MSQLKDLFRMMVKIKECLNQFYYEINNFSSEIELTKSEKKMINALKKCWLFFSFMSCLIVTSLKSSQSPDSD
ncbi:hypothetical protein BpHYR1_004355 [Brachionus plicatilis]|uniref:Uncharacterized protein n=1 Tax=Brachionus plicatilis TaxID=10195 RepID=A0A3M7PLV6_BRAPC|nr:hypothetical protein BpHYR1_004355 [Brachionus plicatilis]